MKTSMKSGLFAAFVVTALVFGAFGGGSDGRAQYCYKGKILAVRVYSETPSSEARLRNLAIDRLRFFGAELSKQSGFAVIVR